MTKLTVVLVPLLAAVLGTVTCANPDGITGKTPGGTLLVRSESDSTDEVDTLLVGREDWLNARGLDTTAATIWTVADTSIVRIVQQVFSRVRVRGLRVGTTTITAEHDGETGTLQLVVREMLASDTIPRVEITTLIDSVIIGDSIPFGFNLYNHNYEYFFDRPFDLSLSDSTVVRVLPMQDGGTHGFWIVGGRLGKTVLTIHCACIEDSVTITVPEPRQAVPDPRAARYEAIDLGTLGGTRTIPLALNDSGDVVGYSVTADGKQHAFLWTNGALQDLAPLSTYSAASVITNDRSIAGTSFVDGVMHIVRWDNGQMTDLGPVGPADQQAGVIGISNTDLVAWGDNGSAIWQNGVKQFLDGFRATAMNSRHQIAGNSGDRPLLWDNGVYSSLEIRGYPSHAVDINSAGLVLGDTPEWTSYWGIRPVITVWLQSRISQTFGWIEPVAINDAGDVVGGLFGSATFYGHDGMWGGIPSLGQGGTFPSDLNNEGMVVGSSWTVAKQRHAFVWQTVGTTPIDLGTGPVTTVRTGSSATAINARGDVIGWTAPCTTPSGRCTDLDQSRVRAVLWRLKKP
jgi:probable HAF family extracellular repeat protein